MSTRTQAGSIGGATGAAGIVYGILMGAGIAGGYSDSTTTGSAGRAAEAFCASAFSGT